MLVSECLMLACEEQGLESGLQESPEGLSLASCNLTVSVRIFVAG